MAANLSELIASLSDTLKEHGDMPVYLAMDGRFTQCVSGAVFDANDKTHDELPPRLFLLSDRTSDSMVKNAMNRAAAIQAGAVIAKAREGKI